MRGKTLDLQALGANNQDTIAVTGGGMSMNARGDILGPGGKIVKKIEQIQEEYEGISGGVKQRISVADSNKMKKFAIKRQFLTPEELQNQLAKIEAEKAKAKKISDQILTKTEMMATSGPVITENPELAQDKKIKPKRTIIDTEE
jgi:hypothetical protein